MDGLLVASGERAIYEAVPTRRPLAPQNKLVNPVKLRLDDLSQGAAYGDDTQSATNYALVRITNNATKHVFYARTVNPSTMAVATGTLPVSTHFMVSARTETGASTLVVVTNGIPSKPVVVTVQ